MGSFGQGWLASIRCVAHVAPGLVLCILVHVLRRIGVGQKPADDPRYNTARGDGCDCKRLSGCESGICLAGKDGYRGVRDPGPVVMGTEGHLAKRRFQHNDTHG